MRIYKLIVTLLLLAPGLLDAQVRLVHDFESPGILGTWFGDDCGINTSAGNPYQQGINTSSKVLDYQDTGGQFANVRLDLRDRLNLIAKHTFSLKIYVPSNAVTGNAPKQVSLKLQDGRILSPWKTQSEIIKTIVYDQWQTLTFDFKNDRYINADPNSFAPYLRSDFSRILIQVNGENNNDHVQAYIDDFEYDGTLPPPAVYGNLIWSDECNGTGMIDTSKWFHQTLLPNGSSWFNGEVQHYTNRNVNSNQSKGNMHIVAKKENFTDQGVAKDYTSARLNSKFAFKYGKVDIMAKMPTGAGTWPALWMLGKNITERGAYWQTKGFGTTGWPACGEIDIIEHWGSNQNWVQSAIHTPSSHGATVNRGGITIPTASTDFHLYTVEWSPQKIVFLVDSSIIYIYEPSSKTPSTWPFDDEQYIILNVALEASIDPSFTESAMEIDYVRVYEYSGVGSEKSPSKNDLNYYPNPVQDHLRVELDTWIDQPIDLKVFASNGSLVKSMRENIHGKEIILSDLETLENGIYLLSFELEEQLYSIRFAKI